MVAGALLILLAAGVALGFGAANKPRVAKAIVLAAAAVFVFFGALILLGRLSGN